MTVLEALANRPERVPPPERRQFNWVAAHRHNAYIHYAWNENPRRKRRFLPSIYPGKNAGERYVGTS